MTRERPLVSIGLPVKNGEKVIGRALQCLLSQTYEKFELIISDNASDDATQEICLRHAEKDKRVRYIRLENRVGAQINFDHVAKQAQGKYFMWAADDDLWVPRFIETLVKELETYPEAGLAMSALDKRMDNGERVETIRFVGDNAINGRSYFEVAMKMATATSPYHFLIYGLFRTPFIIKALEAGFMDVPTFDRIFMIQVALATQIRYVDEILHTRTVYVESPEIRHAEENFIKNHLGDHLLFTCSWMAIEPYLWSSKVIPDFHKPLASILSACYADSFQSILYRKNIGNDQCPAPEKIDDAVRMEMIVADELGKFGANALAHKLVSALAVSHPNSPEVLKKLAEIKRHIGHQTTAEKIEKDIFRRWPQLSTMHK